MAIFNCYVSSPEGIHRCWAVYNALFWCFFEDEMLFCRTLSAIFAYLYLTSTKLSKLSNYCWLVVSIIFFSIVYGIILPIDELHHFSRWWNSTTNQKLSEVSFDDFPIIRYDWRRLNIRLPSWRSPLCAEKKPKLVLFLPNKKESIKGLTCKHWMV